MLKIFSFLNATPSQVSIQNSVKNAEQILHDIVSTKLAHLNILDYTYTTDLAVTELGLEDELVNELVEDYVSQIIKTVVQFEAQINEMYIAKGENQTLDFHSFRELIHKNLGVARNLRIEDAKVLLSEMMESEDLDYLQECLEALAASSIKLKPLCAYKTLKLIEVKSSL
ncbi:MAG: hypothetical protein JXQ67_05990 [Campylobacterales bacterium]|nr:hypothetical protein [Campylobacterales bacterium]